MEIEGFTNYLIYEDGRVYSKSKDKFITHRKNKKNGKTFKVQLWKEGKSKDFAIDKLKGKYYPPQGGTPIKDYETYEIFPDGRVWSNHYCRFMTPNLGEGGYYTLGLRQNKIVKTLKIHRLLALTFISNPNNLPCVDHIDRDKTNNNLDNLRWVSIQDNARNCSLKISNKSGYPGVFETIWGTWSGFYKFEGKVISKSFKKLEDAVKWREEMVRLHYNRPE
jgi:hypothetical protein